MGKGRSPCRLGRGGIFPSSKLPHQQHQWQHHHGRRRRQSRCRVIRTGIGSGIRKPHQAMDAACTTAGRVGPTTPKQARPDITTTLADCSSRQDPQHPYSYSALLFFCFPFSSPICTPDTRPTLSKPSPQFLTFIPLTALHTPRRPPTRGGGGGGGAIYLHCSSRLPRLHAIFVEEARSQRDYTSGDGGIPKAREVRAHVVVSSAARAGEQGTCD